MIGLTAVLSPAATATPKQVATSLARVLPIPALNQTVRNLSNRLRPEGKYYVARHRNISLFAFAGRHGFNAALVVTGNATPSYSRGVWKQFANSRLKNVVAFFTPPGNEASISTRNLPAELGRIASRSYDSVDLEAGMVLITQIDVNGTLKRFLQAMRYPSTNLVAKFGAVLPRTDLRIPGVPPGYKDSPEAYAEITRTGPWRSPFGLPNSTVTDGTFLITSGGTIGFWGNGSVGRGQYIMRYQGPYRIPTQPQDFLDIQMGFGAKKVTLAAAMELTTALYLRSAVGAAAAAPPVRRAQERVAAEISRKINALPLHFIEIVNDKLRSYRFRKGDRPSADKFNYVYLGPLASGGPLVRKTGTLRIFGRDLGSYTSSYGRHGYTESARGRFSLDLGRVGNHTIGRISGDLRFLLNASTGNRDAQMQLTGRLSGSRLANVNVKFDFSRTGVSFSSRANCVFPFNVSGHMTTRSLAQMSLDPVRYNLRASVPNASLPIECAQEILYLVENGAVVAYRGATRLAGIATGAMTNPGSVARIVGNGLRITRGRIVSVSAPAIDAGRIAAGVADKIAKKVAKKLEDGFKKATCAAKELIGKSCKKNKKRPKNAADCNSAQFWNHKFRKCWPKDKYRTQFGLNYFALNGENKGHCMDISEGKNNDNQKLQLWSCNSNWNQRFRYDRSGRNIINEKGKCVTVRGGSGKNANDVVIRKCQYNDRNMIWSVNGGGEFRNLNNRCIRPEKNKRGARLLATGCNPAQAGRVIWVHIPGSADRTSKYAIATPTTVRLAANRNFCLDHSHIQACKKSNKNQHYALGFLDSDRFALINRNKKECLDIRHKSKRSGGEIHRWYCHYEKQQQWTAIGVNRNRYSGERNMARVLRGQFMMKNRNSEKCFATKDGKIGSGIKLRQVNCNPKDRTQVFVLQKP